MNDNSEMMKILETIADRLIDMHLSYNRQFDELKALVAVRAGDQLPLFAVAAAAPASVVPSEDEAMPVVEDTLLASCPPCGTTAYTDADVERFFGYRTPAGKPTIVQSWCRECRKLEAATSPRKKQPLPDDVRDQGKLGRKFLKMAAAKRAERVKVLAASKGRETKESVELLVEEQDLRTEAVRLLSEYDQKRGILRKAKKAAK